MAKKPETTYYTAIHRLLPKDLYREKMFNPYSSGTPDVWYSGTADDLWVEYKYITKVPQKAPIIVQKMLTALQRKWLNDRYREGRNVIVILGTPHMSWVYEKLAWDWPMGIRPSELMMKPEPMPLNGVDGF